MRCSCDMSAFSALGGAMGIYSICSATPGGVLFVSSRGGFFVLDGTAGVFRLSQRLGRSALRRQREGFARPDDGCLSTCSATPAECSSSAAVEAIVRDGTTGVFRPLADSGRSALRRQPWRLSCATGQRVSFDL